MNTDNNYKVYTNARIYTADSSNPIATAFVTNADKFVYVGSDSEAEKYGSSAVNLNGKRVLAGFVDAHAHPVTDAALLSLNAIEIPHSLNKSDALKFIAKKAHGYSIKSLKILTAKGINEDVGKKLSAKDLDCVVADRPLILLTEDCHAACMNTMALKLAEITKSTPDPIVNISYFEHDSRGNPTGRIVETAALYPLIKKLGLCSGRGVKKTLSPMFDAYSKYGYTACVDVGFLMLDEERALYALKRMEEKGKLPLHYFTSYVYFGSVADSPENAIKRMLHLRKKFSSVLLHPNILKLHIDGTLELDSAWMFEDYCIPNMGKGAPLLSMEEMLPIAKLAAAENFDIHVHAIGDRAVDEALKLMDKLGKIRGTKTIAHCQIFPEDGVERFIRQGDIFMQTTPNWLEIHDDFTKRMLGETRYNRQIPIGAITRAGLPVTFGSDSIGGEKGLDPFYNIYCAVQRAFDESNSIMPPRSEALTLQQAINAYTINGARQARADANIGSITAGKFADFVILNRDPFELPVSELKSVRAEKTFFRGNCVFNSCE